MLTQLVGGTVITAPRFDAVTFLKTAERFGVTTTFASPTHLTRLLATPPDTADASTFSTIIANAAPVPYPVKVAWVERFGDDNLFEVYGATELGVVTVLPPEEQLRRPGSCGRPYGGIELLVADEAGAPVPAGTAGELFVRGPGGMSGYHGDAAGPSTRPGGWMSVGDVASLDEDGFVYIRDRLTDMVISGGVNVYPAEVEAVLLDHPAVVDVAVFGVPDDDLGERVVAVVATGEDATVDVAELRALARERLAGPKRPKEYEVRESLPRTDSGKLFKRLLRHEFAVRTPDPPRD
jgi:acyl-CoA synthetase (AMP-forming)/AMP-acid ligase II